MPLLGPNDPLSAAPCRVLVAGNAAAGKSTLARRLSGLLDLPYVEMDSLYHAPGWTLREEFHADADAFSAGPLAAVTKS